MQLPSTGDKALNIPLIQEFLVIAFAVGIAVAAFLGLVWGLSYELEMILTHTSSNQMFFMCLIGIGLFCAGRRYLQREKKI
jgi:hypothetical protein